MAELLQRNMKSIIEELNQMKKANLYTENELSLILKARKDYEYKTNSISKSLQDFTDYIIYEKVLLKQIQNRRTQSLRNEGKNEIEYKILKRIKNLYETGIQCFSTNFDLCFQYFKFCKQFNFVHSILSAIQNMTKSHKHNPKSWQVAANWYAQDKNNPSKAIMLLNEGLTIHKSNKELYTKAINLKLSIMKTDTQDTIQETIVSEEIKIYATLICENIDDYNYLIETLSLLQKYPFTESVQNLMITHLLQKYSEKELVWHTLAERERKGLHYIENRERKPNITLCLDKYKEGLQKVGADEKATLWLRYLDCVIAAYHQNELSSNYKNTFFKAAVEQAATNENYLTEKFYVKWLELATENEAVEILKKGTLAFPDSVELWKLRMQYETLTEKNLEIDKVFKLGVEKLKEKSLPLWFIYLRYYGLLGRTDMISKIYEEAIKQPEEISLTLKPKYLEWLSLTKGIDEARRVYNILVKEKPFCKELHTTMCKLECAEVKCNYLLWSKVHDLACTQFGKEDVDVWLDYVRFYLYYNKDENVNINEKVQQIYRAAEKTLSPLLQNNFKDRYLQIVKEQ